MKKTELHERLKKFVKHELVQIEKPGKPGHVHRFVDPARLSKGLCDFLTFQVDEPTIGRLDSAFWNAVEPLLAEDLAVRSLPDCVERLAATFEPFLKKIAFVRYNSDVLRWSGDGVNYVGLVNTTLADLIRGLVGKTKAGEAAAELSASIIDARGMKGAIYGKTREVRNNVHRAQDYSLAEIVALARTVLASYLLAVEDNIQLIERAVYPQYRYLQRVVEAFRSWEKQYVELEGQEEQFMADIGVLEPIAVEWEPPADDLTVDIVPDASVPISDEAGELEALKPRRRAPISNFVGEFPRLAIIGSGGCGKTTTLQRLVLNDAQRLLSNPSADLPIPVLIEASRYSLTFRFPELVKNELGISDREVESLLDDGKLTLFIDGLNEIATSLQPQALVELKNLLTRWPKPRVVVSSRKSGYQNVLGIATFELQELSDTQIEDFLIRSFADPQHGKNVYLTLRKNPRLVEWARNPLLLRMLTKVVDKGDIPSNRGQMLKRFVSWILSRERKTQPTNVETKEDVLAHIAFQMRKAGNITVEKPVAVELIHEKLVQLSPGVGANDLFQELLENQLLKRTRHEEVRFFHEMIEEYFAGRELARLFLLDADLIARFLSDPRWEEPLIIMAGFLPKKDQLIRTLCGVNLLLAAKSVAAVQDDAPDAFDFVRRHGAESVSQLCQDVMNQGWTRKNIREVVGAACIMRDVDAIRVLCERIPHFSIVSHDALLGGLAFCDRSVLYPILLDATVFQKLMAGRKRDYIIKLWFRAIEDLNLVTDIERAISLCHSMGSALSVQIACGFDPEMALRDINPFRLNLGEKSLRQLFSLVNPEKHARFLRQVFSEDYNPLRLAAALRLTATKDQSVLAFLIEKCAVGKQGERGSILAALSNYGRQRVSEVAVELLSQRKITIPQLLSKPLGDYIELDENFLRASLESGDYIASLLRSPWTEGGTKSALFQIEKYGLGDLLREPLVDMVCTLRAPNPSQLAKRQLCIYKALKGQRFRGVVVLLDSSRGIGSIWCDETQHFYFLRQDEVWGPTQVTIFDAVEFEVATGRKPKKDFEAVKVSKIAQSENEGVVDGLFPARKFGFIRSTPDKRPIFFHFENVSEAELNHLAPGMRVRFVVVPRLKEPHSVQAVRVSLISHRDSR